MESRGPGLTIIVSSLLFILVTMVGTLLIRELRSSAAVNFETPYQAVLLSNGQAYFAKIHGLGTPFPVLTDVYYVQTQLNQQTKETTNVLVRRGKEWHAPDRTVLNATQIVLVEPVTESSHVAKLISEMQKK
jgi:hypothetical protein